jgi:hypothetical protein
MLGNTELHVDLREARTNRCNKREGGGSIAETSSPQAFHQLRSQSSRSALDVQRSMARLRAGQFRERHR